MKWLSGFFSLLQEREGSIHDYPIIVNSIPKSGTNLLMNIIINIPGVRKGKNFSLAGSEKKEDRLSYIKNRVGKLKAGYVYTGHMPFSEDYSKWLRANNAKQFFIYRDPRDVTVSLYHYIMEKVPRHAYFDLMNVLENNDMRLLASINGLGKGKSVFEVNEQSIPNIGIVYKEYEQWLNEPSTLAVRYEDIVSNDGCDVVDKILKFLKIEKKLGSVSSNEIWLAGKSPDKSRTYRMGKKDGWKKEYQQAHINAFNLIFNEELLKAYGYKR